MEIVADGLVDDKLWMVNSANSGAQPWVGEGSLAREEEE